MCGNTLRTWSTIKSNSLLALPSTHSYAGIQTHTKSRKEMYHVREYSEDSQLLSQLVQYRCIAYSHTMHTYIAECQSVESTDVRRVESSKVSPRKPELVLLYQDVFTGRMPNKQLVASKYVAV